MNSPTCDKELMHQQLLPGGSKVHKLGAYAAFFAAQAGAYVSNYPIHVFAA